MAKNSKRHWFGVNIMHIHPRLSLIIAGVLCAALAILGATMPPLSDEELVFIIIYEFGVFAGLILLLFTIDRRGIPAEMKN